MQLVMDHIRELFSATRYLYWFLALMGTFIFLIQIIMTFLGFGGDSDVNADGHVDYGEHSDVGFAEFRFFSFRSIIAFITFFGWGGVLWGSSGWGGFIIALMCGLAMMFITASLIFGLLQLQNSGNISPKNIIGCSGTVYFTVPAGRIETGKVTVTVKNCTREITAIADEELPTGTSVTVENQIDGKRFLVKKI